MNDQTDLTDQPDDVALLAAVSRIWAQMDPPPEGLAEGALARIAAEDLEFELLTLVENSDDALAGVRHAAPEEGPETGAWMLEYEGPDVRIYVRLTKIEDSTRLDGWVVPVRHLAVHLSVNGGDEPIESAVDEFGRFEFPSAQRGLARLTFIDDARDGAKPRVTPPFWI